MSQTNLQFTTKVLLGIVYGALAVLVNVYLEISVYGDMSFHLGEVLVILCLVQFGFLPAIIASLIASLSLFFVLDNPFYFIILSLEIIVLNLLLKRGLFVLIADIVYWILVGMPLIIIILMFISSESAFDYNNFVLITKQAINGILYTSIASAIAPFLPKHWFKVSWHQSLPPMSTKIFEFFSTITTITGVATGLIMVELSVRDNEAQMQRNLENKAQQANAFITSYIRSHQTNIESLAESLTLNPDAMINGRRILNRNQEHYPGFITMLIADDKANIVAGAPDHFYEVLSKAPAESRNVSDRDYFIDAKEEAESFISQAFVGRGFGDHIIVAISAPFYKNYEFAGIVEGSLNLSRFSKVESDIGREDGEYFILVDTNQNIIYSSEALAKAPFEKLMFDVPDQEYATYARLLQMPVGNSQKDFFFESTSTINGWRVFVLQDTNYINSIVEKYYRYLMFLLGSVFLLSFVLARFLSKNLTRPLEIIVKEMSAMDSRQLAFEKSAFTKETLSLRDRLEQAKQMYIDFQNQLKSEVDKRTKELSEANLQLEKLSREDSLTGLLNRRAFDSELSYDLKRNIRFETPLCLSLLDIDYFKKINDNYGHPVGDEFIKAVGEVLSQQMQRETDIVARIGGEEFAILFHADSASACQLKLESVRNAVMSIKIDVEDKKIGTSISAGALYLIPDKSTTTTVIYSHVDKLLYESKKAGRNQLTFEEKNNQ